MRAFKIHWLYLFKSITFRGQSLIVTLQKQKWCWNNIYMY